MKKLRVIPALLAVGCLTLAGTTQVLAQTSSTPTAQVERSHDGRQDDRLRPDRPRDRRRHRPDRPHRVDRPDRVRPDRPDRPHRPDRPARPDWPERPERPNAVR